MPAAHPMHLYFAKINLVGRHISGVRVRLSREGMKYCSLSSRLAIIRYIGRLVDEMIVCIDENQEVCEQRRQVMSVATSKFIRDFRNHNAVPTTEQESEFRSIDGPWWVT